MVDARSQSVSFNQLHPCDHSRVKQVLYCQAEDKPVSRSQLVKGFSRRRDGRGRQAAHRRRSRSAQLRRQCSQRESYATGDLVHGRLIGKLQSDATDLSNR